MKQTAKVFIWLGMIFQCVLIYPIVIGILALKKIDEAQSTDELKTLGIITTLFCSLLGGLFMLEIKNEELMGIEPRKRVVVSSEEVEPAELDEKGKKVKAITQFGMYLLCPLLLTNLLFGIVPCTYLTGVTYLPVIFTAYQIVLFVPILILYFKNNQRLSKTNTILLLVFSAIAIALVIFSVVTNYCLAYDHYYTGSHYHNHIYGEAWEFWVVFGLSIAILTISLGIAILNLTTKQLSNPTKPQKSTTSNVEMELNEAKRLFDIGIITEAEYSSIRSSIIGKYFK